MYASVAIDIQTNNLKDVYDYIVPEELINYVGIGSRVKVDFGVRRVLGYIIELKNETSYTGEMKEIAEVLDFSKELTIEQIELAKKIAHDTKCPLIKTLDVMFPPFLKTKFRKFISIKNANFLDPNIFVLFNNKKKICLTSDLVKKYPRISREIQKGNLELEYDVYSYGKNKKIKMYSLNESCENIYKDFIGIRKDIVKYIDRKGQVTLEELKEFVGCSNYIVSSMVKDEYLTIKEVDLINEKIKDKTKLVNLKFDFRKKEIKDKYNIMGNKPFLFSCNDDGFANELYLDICIDNIKQDKKVLIVVPTLISFYNLYYYLRRKLEGFDVVNFSGDMSNSDFYENYIKVRHNEYDVAISTKVGVFLPYNNLGAIIVLDESNYNYLSEMTPKYNCIEVLKQRAAYHNAKIILESTPLTVDNYYNYYKAEYNLLKYTVNVSSNVNMVDMKQEMFKNRPVISTLLESKIRNSLSRGKQAMLILNARGYSSYIKCKSCGEVIKCPKCNIPLTYYKEKEEIKCKYCGRKLEDTNLNNSISSKCKCGSNELSLFGLGLELAKEHIENLFPDAKTMIIDSGTLREFEDYKSAVVKIESGEVDIILGTSNVLSLATYADLDLISLLQVDNILNFSDYRASFNTFSLIYNSLNVENVVIQGFNLDHYSIKYGVLGNFDSFYMQEIEYRKLLNYPPFTEINKILITGDYKDIYYCANYFKKVYSSIFKVNDMVLGPTYIKLRKGVQLIIKNNDFEKLSTLIDEVENKFSGKVQISFERYPRSLS